MAKDFWGRKLLEKRINADLIEISELVSLFDDNDSEYWAFIRTSEALRQQLNEIVQRVPNIEPMGST